MIYAWMKWIIVTFMIHSRLKYVCRDIIGKLFSPLYRHFHSLAAASVIAIFFNNYSHLGTLPLLLLSLLLLLDSSSFSFFASTIRIGCRDLIVVDLSDEVLGGVNPIDSMWFVRKFYRRRRRRQINNLILMVHSWSNK